MTDVKWVVARVPIEIKQGDSGLFFGLSPLHKGILVTGHSEREVLEKAVGAIEDIGCACAGVPALQAER
jgi:hypothetical protein